MKRKEVIILGILVSLLLILALNRGYEDIPLVPKLEKYITSFYKEITEESVLNDLFEGEEIRIKNAEIYKGWDNNHKEEINRIVFKKGGSISLASPSLVPPKFNPIVLNFKEDNNEIVFDKEGNIIEARMTLKEEEEIVIKNWVVKIPKDGQLYFNGNNFIIRAPEEGVIKKPLILSPKGNPHGRFEFTSLEKGGSFKLNVDEFQSKKFNDGLKIKGSVYYEKREYKTSIIDPLTGKYKTAERRNFYTKDDVTIENMDIKFDSKNPIDVLVLGFNDKILDEASIINENYLVFSEYVLEGEESIEGWDNIYGYRLDVIKKDNKPFIKINFNKENPIFTGDEKVVLNFGKGEYKEGFSETSIIERGIEAPLFETKGWNTLNFNGDIIYTKYNDKNGMTEIYRKVKNNIPKKSENNFIIRTYKQKKEVISKEQLFDPSGYYEVLKFSEEYRVERGTKTYGKGVRVKLIGPRFMDKREHWVQDIIKKNRQKSF